MAGYDSICCFRSRESSSSLLLWEITTFCNLNCYFCHRTKPYQYGPTLEEIKSTAVKLKSVGINDIILSGGEPLIRKDFFDIVRFLREQGYNLDVCTNAYKLDKSIIPLLKSYFNEISVSLDSCQPLLHNELRGRKDAFLSTVKGLDLLIENDFDVHVTTLINEKTIEFAEETVDFLYKRGIRSIALIGEVPVNETDYFIISNETQTNLMNLVKKMRAKYSDLRLNTKELFLNATFNSCLAGVKIFSIDASLKLSPCSLLRYVPTLDLRKASEREILQYCADIQLQINSKCAKINKSCNDGICPGSASLWQKSIRRI